MEYAIHTLAKMSGVSTRTLRYYHEVGLLTPMRTASSGYRIYGQAQVNALQQILFYRELDFPLTDIRKLLSAPDFDRAQAFARQLSALRGKRARLDKLIATLTKSISAMKGEVEMSDSEKFEGFKQTLIRENEEKYGAEIRAKYGDAEIRASNAALQGLTKEQYDAGETLRLTLEETLRAAAASGDPAGELAQKACALHQQWLCLYYPKYSREYHMGLGELYVADERFKAHYEALAPGCAAFFRDAIRIYCQA